MREKPVWRRYLRLLGSDPVADADDELAFHLSMRVEDLMRSGIPESEARRRAEREFGDVGRIRRELTGIGRTRQRRERRRRGWESLVQDLRFAVRTLRSNSGFTLGAVLTLALGIGASTAIFSVVDGVLLRPLPFRAPEELVVVWETDRASGTDREPASWPDFVDFRERSRTLRDAEAVMAAEATLAPEAGDAERLSSVAVTHGYFDLVGVEPVLGRAMTAEEDRPGGPRVALLGERLWRSSYGSDPGIIGRTIRLNGVPHEVIGVMPADADFGLDQVHARAAYHPAYTGEGSVDVWTPLQADAERYPRETHPIFVIGRLAPGSDADAAQREHAAVAADLEQAYPENEARGVNVEPLETVVFGPVRPALMVLLGAVGLVLLVACVNVASLLLARGTARAREVSVRAALGAGTGRLARQFAAESLLLALLGAVAGVALAFGGLRVLLAMAPADLPRLGDVGIDARVLGATLAVTLLVGLVFGIVPTVQSRRIDVAGALRSGGRAGSEGRSRGRLRVTLVVVEVAAAVALVVGASLLVRSFRSVLEVDPGFEAEGILKAEYQLPATRYPQGFATYPNWVEVHAFDTALLERVRALPGVESAAIANVHPLDAGITNSFVIVGREAEAHDWPEISLRNVTPGYFATVGLDVVAGRGLLDGDVADAPMVALINRSAADRFFAGRDPLGHEIRFWGIARRIVGVVEDERIHGLTEAVPPAVYVPLAQAPWPGGALLVRATDPERLAGPVRAAVRDIDPGLAVYGIEPLERTLAGSVSRHRFPMMLLGAFAVLALVLALVGTYGMLSYTTARRTREIGIRIALGASRRSVLLQVLREGIGFAGLGIALGLAIALAGSRLVEGMLFGVEPTDPAIYLLVAVVVLAAAVVACWAPARRAMAVPPQEALRGE